MLTQGFGQDGHPLAPVMPYSWYGAISTDDLDSVVAYLRSVPAIENKTADISDEAKATATAFLVVDADGNPRLFEIVYVDDQSKDDSFQVLKDLMGSVPELRVVQHIKQSGQSTAVRNGVKASRGLWIATLDGDGQNRAGQHGHEAGRPAGFSAVHQRHRPGQRGEQAARRKN